MKKVFNQLLAVVICFLMAFTVISCTSGKTSTSSSKSRNSKSNSSSISSSLSQEQLSSISSSSLEENSSSSQVENSSSSSSSGQTTASSSSSTVLPTSSTTTSSTVNSASTSSTSSQVTSSTTTSSSSTSSSSSSSNGSGSGTTTPEEPQEINEITLGSVRVQLLSDTLVRIENEGPKGFEDRESYIVTNRDKWTTVEYEIKNGTSETVIKTSAYSVHLPLNGTAEQAFVTTPGNDKTLWTYQGMTDTNVYLPSPSDELKSWYFTDSPRIIPSDEGWVNTGEVMQGWDFDNDATDIFVFLPDGDYRTFTEDYTSLTGESELVQLQTLGYWDSRWYAYSSETALQQIKDYTDRGYSIDVLVIDTDWRGAPEEGDWGSGGIGYDVNTALFPDMAGFLAQCEELGVDICFNDHPEPVTGTTSGLDGEEIDYRTEKLTMILSLGVDYWWYDRNWSVSLNSIDPEISVYAFGMYAYQFVTEQYLESITDLNEYAERALIMANVDGCLHGKWNYASDISAHRYSIQWTGDIYVNSDALAQEIYATVFGGVEVGLPYMSSDIGGHNGTVSNELYSRWIQYGALSTICRVHCTHEKYISQEGRMPWLFGETAEQITHSYIDMRYRLLPLFYYLSYRNYDTGLPIMQRTDVLYPNYIEAQANDQYMLGDNILVAPIATAGPTEKIPDTYLTHDSGSNKASGLKAEYYNNDSWSGTPAVSKIDSNIFYNWGTGSPEGIPTDYFSVKWTGYFTVGDIPGYLSFYADDMIRVWIDGVSVVDSDPTGGDGSDNVIDTMFSTPLYDANTTHTIEVHYIEASGNAHVYMYYNEKIGTSASYDTRNVFIPDGTWIDVWSGDRFVGPKTYTVTHPLETSPIYVREGSLVALAKNMQNTSADTWQDMSLEVYPSTNFTAQTTLYEDDTKTVAYKEGKFRTTSIEMLYNETKGAVMVTIYPAQGSFDGERAFTTRNWNVRIHTNPGWGSVTSVKVNGTDTTGTLYAQSSTAQPFAFTGAALDSDIYELLLQNKDIYQKIEIEIYFENVIASSINANYDNTSVEYSLSVDQAGDMVNLDECGEVSWISFGDTTASTAVEKSGASTLISYPSSYETPWINFTTFFTTIYENSGDTIYSTGGISSYKDFSFEIQTIGREAYYVLYVGGNQSTAKVTVSDRAGNKTTEFFGDIDGRYTRRIVIHVTDTTVSTLYVTYSMHASEPDGLGTKSYLNVMAGLVSETLPSSSTANVTISATAEVSDIAGQSINLTTSEAIYWEHYQVGNTNKMNGANDVITNSAENITQAFYDYKANMNWSNGSNDLSVSGNTNGICQPSTEYTINIAINPNVKKILVYTGAWNATGTATIYASNGNLLATSTSWTAGSDAIARLVTFNITVDNATMVTIKVTPSNVSNYGNVSMVAVALLKEKPADLTSATAEVSDIASQNIYLNSAETLYWEHYQTSGTNKMINATDIVTNSIETTASTFGFNDYKATLNWTNGSIDAAYITNNNGVCAGNTEYAITVQINSKVQKIQVYTGAWRATGTATIYNSNGALLATSSSWTAGEDGIARLVTFNITATQETFVTIKITPSEVGESGNCSMVAVAVLGTPTTATTSLSLNTTEMTGYDSCKYNLTEIGTADWYYLNSADEKANGTAIDTSSLKVEGNNLFWDYKAAFSWTNGTTNATSPIDDDCNNAGTNNGKCGAYVQIDIAVDANTDKVVLWVGGWQSTYFIEAIDSNGNILVHQKMHDKVDGVTYAYMAEFTVTAQTAETLSFVIYRTDANNCSLAAVAVSNK